MKKLLRLLCLAAIVCVAYLALTTPRGAAEPVMKTTGAEADDPAGQPETGDTGVDDIADRVKAAGQDALKRADGAIEDAVKQADEVLDNAAEQADKAIGDAVDSAVQGAKQGFLESLKESASEFWEGLFP